MMESQFLPEIDPELDYQYNNTNWLIKTREPGCFGDGAIKHLISLLLKQSELSRSLFSDRGVFRVPFSEDIVLEEDGFGEYSFDWFPPANRSVLPANIVVYIHGGYWKSIGWRECSHWALPIVNADCIFVSLAYKLAPKEKLEFMPQCLCLGMQKVINLTQKMFSQQDVKKLNITLVGHSAGAHLILEMIHHAQKQAAANENWLTSLRNLVLISGVYDLRPIIRTNVNKALKLKSVEEAWCVSPIRHFTQDDVSVLLQKPLHWLVAWTEYESPAIQKQSKVLIEMLDEASKRNKQFTYESLCIENEDHFTIILGLHSGSNSSRMLKKILQLTNNTYN
ncbi:unnamed protein product [Trichobilharzia szidati]|nr:unnamed protein product [Trichobilharzia szidati]